jgi:thiol:disulfide interchange protein DsbD
MERLKQILAFALYGGAAWLVWVLSQQLDPAGLALVLASLIAVGFAAWCYGIAPTAPHRQRWLAIAIAAVIVAGATIAAVGPRAAASPTASAGVEPFTPERLAALRAEGKPVLVNFTAAWCITCLVNERVALSRPEVQAAIRESGVTFLKGDWTNRNAAITAALHDLGRDGVPVYVLYPVNGAPQLLPQILTPRLVMNALKELRVSSASRTESAS